MKTIFLSAGSLLLFAACKSNLKEPKDKTIHVVETTQWLNPINDLRIEPVTFSFSTEKDKVIELETGSKLFIPANSFIDIEGNPIVGEVKLNFNEYHSFGEVMLSGLPMIYDSAGVDQQMITGGMFKIEAYQHGEELFLAKDKRIKVDINSKTGVERMNFYQLNENSGDWTYKQAGTGIKKKRNILEDIETETIKNDDYSLLDIPLKTNHLKELEGKTIVGWKTKRKLTTKVQNQLKFSLVGSELTATKTENQYRLVITKPITKESNEQFEIIVEPYFIEQAVQDSKEVKEDYKRNVREIDDYIDRVAKNEVVRSIEIASMGVYNWDYLYHRECTKQLECRLNFPNHTNSDFVNIFTICPEDNAVIRLNFKTQGHYVYDPTKRNCIVAITKDNRVYYIPNDAFVEQRKENKLLDFDFIKSDVVLNSTSSFDKHLHTFI